MFRSTPQHVNRRTAAADPFAHVLTSRRWLRALLGGLAGALLPPHCCLCDAPGQAGPAPWGLDLCPHCQAACPALPPACPRCGTPEAQGRTCADCVVRPPPFDALFAACAYAPPADHLVRELKFNGALAPGRVLGLLLAARRARDPTPLPAVVVPLPLHRDRLAERGFNQAQVIARAAATTLGLPLRPALLRRVRGGPRQSGLGAADRRSNLVGAFVAGPSAGCGSVALVDDVFTTGSTARAAALALKDAGAARVEVWTATRALAMERDPIC